MKAFLLKHKLTILYWLIFVPVAVYFVLEEPEYYLDSDIKYFKRHYFVPTLTWTGVVVCTALFFVVFVNTKSVKESTISFLSGSVMVAFFLFCFHTIVLAACLFINRQLKRDGVEKSYLVSYMAGGEQTKDTFLPYDISAKRICTDLRIRERLYRPALKQNDTVILKLDKGLLGLPYLTEPFNDK